MNCIKKAIFQRENISANFLLLSRVKKELLPYDKTHFLISVFDIQYETLFFSDFTYYKKHCLLSVFSIQKQTFLLLCFYTIHEYTITNIISLCVFTTQQEIFPFLLFFLQKGNIASFLILLYNKKHFPFSVFT